MIEIYALCDPFSGEVRYVGKARDSAMRLAAHRRERRRAYPVYRWLGSLGGVSPELRVLETVANGAWQEAERRWITLYRASGRLLNVADGGDEPMPTREQRAASARAATKVRESAPRKRLNDKLRELGCVAGWAQRNGRLFLAYKCRFMANVARAAL